MLIESFHQHFARCGDEKWFSISIEIRKRIEHYQLISSTATNPFTKWHLINRFWFAIKNNFRRFFPQYPILELIGLNWLWKLTWFHFAIFTICYFYNLLSFILIDWYEHSCEMRSLTNWFKLIDYHQKKSLSSKK